MKQFAPNYIREEHGWILFPSDTSYRAQIFPEEVNKHSAKANVHLIQACIEYVSAPGDRLLDPFGGTGTLMIGALAGRDVVLIEISPVFHELQRTALKRLEEIAPGASDHVTLINAPLQTVLPMPNFADHIIFSPPYCLHPNTLILTSYLSWKKLAEVQVGDDLIGFDAESSGNGRGSGRKMRHSIVIAKRETTEEAFRITLSNGDSVVASSHHGWLRVKFFGKQRQHTLDWIETKDIVVGEKLKFISRPWEYDTSREAGYLAGVYDGEGWINRQSLGFRQNKGEVLDYTRYLLYSKGFPYGETEGGSGRSNECSSLYIDRQFESMRFLGAIRPHRLVAQSEVIWLGKEIRSRIGKSTEIEVVSIESVGLQSLVDLQTSTGTFIAQGLMSHNSSIMRSKGKDKLTMEKTDYDMAEYSKHPLNLGLSDDFTWALEMKKVYQKCYGTLRPGGTITVIVKDHYEKQKSGERRRVPLSMSAWQACVEIGFQAVVWEKWKAPGSVYTHIYKARGWEVVEDEDVLVLRRP